MKLLKKLTNYLIYGNIFIALCAFSITLATISLFHKNVFEKLYFHLAGFVGFATLFSYSIHRIKDLKSKSDNAYAEVIYWSKKNTFFIYLLTVVSILGMFFILFLPHNYFKGNERFYLIELILNRKILYLLPLSGIITLLYSIPIKIRQIEVNIRKFQFAKIFLIAIVWSFATSILAASFRITIPGEFYLVFIERFLFIFAITIPFDIRDAEFDKKEGIKTYATQFGTQTSLNIASFLLLLLIGLSAVQHNFYVSLFYCLLIPVVLKAKKPQHEYYYLAILDGTIIIYSFLLIFF